MSKCNFDEVTKEELLDSIRKLTEALENHLSSLPCYECYGGVSGCRAIERALYDHGYGVYSETYELPE